MKNKQVPPVRGRPAVIANYYYADFETGARRVIPFLSPLIIRDVLEIAFDPRSDADRFREDSSSSTETERRAILRETFIMLTSFACERRAVILKFVVASLISKRAPRQELNEKKKL